METFSHRHFKGRTIIEACKGAIHIEFHPQGVVFPDKRKMLRFVRRPYQAIIAFCGEHIVSYTQTSEVQFAGVSPLLVTQVVPRVLTHG